MTAGLSAALSYRKLGLGLLPVRAGDKLPNFDVLEAVHGSKDWGPLRQRCATEAEIIAWFEHDQDTGLAIITGPPSGDLVVADVDVPTIPFEHPRTPTVRTGRGWHLYFRGCEAKTRKFAWGELRGEGAYVVAPPSRHSSGAEYEFKVGFDEAFADLSTVFPQTKPSPRSDLDLNNPADPGIYELPVSTSLSAEGDKQRLGYDADAVAAAVRKMVGEHARVNVPFCCVIPGHTEQRASASVFRDPRTGLFVYRDWHQRGPEWLTLAQVRAAQGYGAVQELRGPEAARWYDRLFFEAGILKPEPVPLPSLPSDARMPVVLARQGFGLLLGLRWLTEPVGTPTPFARSFISGWCGLAPSTAERAKVELLRLDVIRKVADYGSGPRRTSMYLPGSERPRFGRGQVSERWR